MEQITEQSGNSGVDKEWEAARQYAELLHFCPRSFSSLVRTLVGEQFSHQGQLKPVTKYHTARLLKPPSFRAMMYFASLAHFPKAFQDKEFVSLGSMIDLYEPFDLAGMISSFYYYRLAQRKLGVDAFWTLRGRILLGSEIGSLVGNAIPEIGTGLGLLVGTLRNLAYTPFAIHDMKGFEGYTRKLEHEKKTVDLEREKEIWGCTSLQVAAFLLSNIGFGVEVSDCFVHGMDPRASIRPSNHDLIRRIRYAFLWTESLTLRRAEPEGKIPSEFYPLANERDFLFKSCEQVFEGRPAWLNAEKSLISPEKTPQLFQSAVDSDVPEELQDVFSMDDISSMEERDFEDLIDRIEEDVEKDSELSSLEDDMKGFE